MVRHVTIALLAFTSLFAAAATAGTAPAQASGSHYRADPAAMPAGQRLVVRDMVWRCGGGSCTSGENGSRPAVICASLAREVGQLRSFSAGGHAFDAAALESCNRRAR
jgi:hypothetical protein